MTALPPAFLVTGASTGIGRAVTVRLLAAGWTGFATVRRIEDAPPGATALLADVTDPASLDAARETVERALAGRRLAALVINAGIALPGPLLHQPLDEIRETFDVNVIGAVATMQAFVPLMLPVGDGPARIVAISSVSGRIAAPLVGAYAASKHALEALCDSLRRELMLHGIDVAIVEPGPIATPIWDKGLAFGGSRYAATPYRDAVAAMTAHFAGSVAHALPATRVADVVLEALTARRPRSRYVVTARPLMDFWLPRLLPDRLLDRLIAGRLALTRKRG
ncbi:MAG: SDR family NAD(P)-dependent oxidoreductase [Rhodoplanes sp.]|uniref:SDR family NAD(P)-dependent oxidoreductase n=1 Tax=Rhodoplanes sp. TaxID=1968906 RepID=UPI0017B9041B|nr:SDR family NAD(P)-dependent oxidoreductase [Rhodoplanes sp.]NVO13385.1 SDR family NAD(P)-dependent oxidoreductase [Rhodoplanes sp.]